MKEKNLEIQVVNSEEEFKLFWDMHYEYMNRDIFPNDELGLEITEKEREWFFSSEYKKHMYKLLGILARGYIYRNSNARVFGIQKENRIIEMLMVRDINEEPECYELQQFLIDVKYQNKGYGYKALKLILDYLYVEGRYENVEVCVKKEDVNAIKLYKKIGFINTGYIDPNVEDAYNLVFSFMDLDAAIQANRGSVIR